MTTKSQNVVDQGNPAAATLSLRGLSVDDAIKFTEKLTGYDDDGDLSEIMLSHHLMRLPLEILW